MHALPENSLAHAYVRAARLTRLFCRSSGLHRQHPRAHDFYEVVWFRTAGISLADKFKV